MPLKTHHDDMPALNLTPLIDVVFLLLIFFMVATKFTELERKIGLEVPEVADHKSLSETPAVRLVNVFKDGVILLDKEPVTLAELTQRLAAARRRSPELSVTVRGDGAISYQQMAEVFSACKQAGISDLGMSVRVAAKRQ